MTAVRFFAFLAAVAAAAPVGAFVTPPCTGQAIGAGRAWGAGSHVGAETSGTDGDRYLVCGQKEKRCVFSFVGTCVMRANM